MIEKEEMVNDMVKDLALLLMDKEKPLSMEQVLSLVFNSDTYIKLLDDKARLYFQSPRYVFSYLENELETGKVG